MNLLSRRASKEVEKVTSPRLSIARASSFTTADYAERLQQTTRRNSKLVHQTSSRPAITAAHARPVNPVPRPVNPALRPVNEMVYQTTSSRLIASTLRPVNPVPPSVHFFSTARDSRVTDRGVKVTARERGSIRPVDMPVHQTSSLLPRSLKMSSADCVYQRSPSFTAATSQGQASSQGHVKVKRTATPQGQASSQGHVKVKRTATPQGRCSSLRAQPASVSRKDTFKQIGYLLQGRVKF